MPKNSIRYTKGIHCSVSLICYSYGNVYCGDVIEWFIASHCSATYARVQGRFQPAGEVRERFPLYWCWFHRFWLRGTGQWSEPVITRSGRQVKSWIRFAVLRSHKTGSHDIKVNWILLFIQHGCYFKCFNDHIYYAFTNTSKYIFLFYLFCIRQSTAVYDEYRYRPESSWDLIFNRSVNPKGKKFTVSRNKSQKIYR